MCCNYEGLGIKDENGNKSLNGTNIEDLRKLKKHNIAILMENASNECQKDQITDFFSAENTQKRAKYHGVERMVALFGNF